MTSGFGFLIALARNATAAFAPLIAEKQYNK